MSTVTYNDTDFETEFPVSGWSDPIVGVNADGKVEVAYLTDDVADTEYEFEEGVEFKEFRTEWDRNEFMAAKVEEFGAEFVFIVEHYEHSGSHFSLVNEGQYPDRRWDVRPSVVLVVPTDVTEPREFAKGVLDTYNSYLAGDNYGLVIETFEKDGSPVFADAVWGYIGDDYAQAELRAMATTGVEA